MIINSSNNENEKEVSRYKWMSSIKNLYEYIKQNSFWKIRRELGEKGVEVPELPDPGRVSIMPVEKSPPPWRPDWLTGYDPPGRVIRKPDFSKSKGRFPIPPFLRREKDRNRLIPEPPPPNIKPDPKAKDGRPRRIAVTKYEYVYGIKHLEIKHKQYDNRSIFVSKPMEVEGNVMQVSLHAVEEHPLFDTLNGQATDRKTSVEYYISYVENPSLEDWHPILPEDVKTVKCELLMFNTARTADLRFPALIGADATVYKNGLKINEDDWSFVDGGTRIQLLVEHDPTAVYTIDYTPNAEIYNPWTLDIHQRGAKRVKQIDRFPDGTNHNKTVILSKYPYVDYEKIYSDANYDPNLSDYKPIIVRLKNANIAGTNRTIHKEVPPYDGTDTQPVCTKNVTNYKTGEWKELKPYSIVPGNIYPVFEYWHEGNKLYFSETFNKADIYTNQELNHGNAEIEVEYETLVSNFRLKIILRRNAGEERTVTPIVHEYALKFRIAK